jgi:hypothetical protein
MRNRVRRIPRALALAALLAAGVAFADGTWAVETLVPELISIRVPSTLIAFGFDAATYPPAAFPARYPALQPEGGVLPVEVFANAAGTWSLLLAVPDLVDGVTGSRIPAEQVLYRVDDGPWTRASAAPQIAYTGMGPTEGWRLLRVAFVLELQGTERNGAYRVDAVVSAIHEPRP